MTQADDWGRMVVIDGVVVWTVWPVLAALVVVFQMRRWRGLWHTLAMLWLCTYALWIASVVFFPMPLLPNDHLMEEWPSLNFVPLQSLIESFRQEDAHTLVRLHGGNFCLLVPFTLLGPVLWPALRLWWKALLLGLAISLSIEVVQFALGGVVGDYYRSVDIDDVILNVGGAMSGYWLYSAGGRWMARRQTDAAGA